jgi:tRNA nucleotidyltransferase/poly(A) polymerase
VSSTDPRLLALLDEPLVRALRRAAGATPTHLVGGLLRDRLLGIGGSDLDAVVASDGLAIGRRLSRDLPARLVELGGRAFAAYRLAGRGFTLDIWDRRGQSLEADLARRDFTVNAFALDVKDGRLIDPFGGLADLARRQLRATSDGVFADDPLRVLRLVRLALQPPGFRPDPASLALARQAGRRLADVAAERIREELGKILRAPRLRPGLELLVRLDLYPGLLLGTPGAAGEARRTDRLLRRLAPAIEQLAGRRDPPHGRLDPAGPRLAVLLAGLATAAGEAEETLERCRRASYLTGRETALCRRLLGCRQAPDSPAAERWFLHLWSADWPAAAATLAAIAKPPLSADDRRRLLARLTELAEREGARIFAPRPLLDGDEIARLLGIGPGPRLGEAVERLRRAQVEGRVDDRAAAEALLRSSAADAD